MSDWKEQKLKPGIMPDHLANYKVVKHRIGNQTNADANNNKFFSIELLECDNKYYVYTNYGRVSTEEYTGAAGLYGPGTEYEASEFFELKFKSKVRPSKGYIEIEFITAKVGSPKAREQKHKIDDSQIPDEKREKLKESKTVNTKQITLHPDVKRLVEQWYSDNTHSITSNAAVTITSDGLETPLGVLTFKQINKGRTILTDIAEAIKDNNTTEVRKLSGAFYSNIPAHLGRKITDDDLISTEDLVQSKAELLTQMEDALEIGGASFLSGTEQKYLDLGVDIELLNKSDSEWNRIDHFIQSTRGHNHYGTSSKVKNVLKVELQADRNRYNKCNIGNEAELFHGSRNGNSLGILSRGLLIAPPSAPITGWMFSKGIYAASSSSKSLNYSSARFGGPRNTLNNCFLYIIKVRLGKQKKLNYADYNAHNYCINGGSFDSVMGCKGLSLIHDEYIVYTLEQVTITHMVEIQC